MFAPQVTYAAATARGGLAAGDFNADGRLDLAVSNENDNTVSVLLNAGAGVFAQATFTLGYNPNSVAVGDFNGDGLADIAATNQYDNSVSVLLSVCP